MNALLDDYLGELMAESVPTSAHLSTSPAIASVQVPDTGPEASPARPSAGPVPASAGALGSLEPNPLLPGHPVVRGTAARPRHRRAEERFTSWLRFQLSGQSFAVEVLKVQEVMRVPDILALRGTPAWMLGMMNLRGQIVPVTDLTVRLGLVPMERGPSARVVVLELRGEAMGLLVDSVAEVHAISDAAIEDLGGPLSGPEAAVLRGIARRDALTLTLLHAERLLA